MTSNTQRFEIQRHSRGKGWGPFENEGWTDAGNDLRFIACDGQKTHLHDYRATRISINIPLCVFMGMGTARRAKEPRSAVYALHPSVFPRALCHRVRGSPSESPLPGSNKHKGRSRAPALTLPAAGQQRLRLETKTALEKKKEKEKSGEEAQGGERTESLNIKSGAPRHTSRH